MDSNWPAIFSCVLFMQFYKQSIWGGGWGGALEREGKTKHKNYKPRFCVSLEFPAVTLGWHKSSVSLAYCNCSSSWRMRSWSRFCCFSLSPTLECLWTLAGHFHRGTVRKNGSRSASLVRHLLETPECTLTGVIFILHGKGTKPEILWNVTKIIVYETDLKMLIFQSCF